MKKRTLNPAIIRPGDTVKLLRLRPIVRVGYPKTVQDYIPKAEEVFGPLLNKEFGLDPDNGRRKRLIHDMAHLYARQDGFGGRERTIHWAQKPVEEMLGETFYVEKLITRHTGRYYPPSGGGYSYYDEWDWEPGGLEGEKRHRIVVALRWTGTSFWFLREDVEKVQRVTP